MTAVDPKVFRTYDIRALVPELVDEKSLYFGKVGAADAYQAPLTPEGVEQIGRGLADFFGAPTVVIGYDARLTSPEWAAALARGMNRQGVDVLDIGLATTDMMYYASGKFGLPAVEITASHCTKARAGETAASSTIVRTASWRMPLANTRVGVADSEKCRLQDRTPPQPSNRASASPRAARRHGTGPTDPEAFGRPKRRPWSACARTSAPASSTPCA